MLSENNRFPSYDMTINVRVAWQAHSISNAGDNGSNRLLPRTQLLADQTITDACSGDILKHHHAALLTEYSEAEGRPLCPACRLRPVEAGHGGLRGGGAPAVPAASRDGSPPHARPGARRDLAPVPAVYPLQRLDRRRPAGRLFRRPRGALSRRRFSRGRAPGRARSGSGGRRSRRCAPRNRHAAAAPSPKSGTGSSLHPRTAA